MFISGTVVKSREVIFLHDDIGSARQLFPVRTSWLVLTLYDKMMEQNFLTKFMRDGDVVN